MNSLHFDIKNKFPIFENNPELVYLDNAATTQKPQQVLEAEFDFYTKYNSNIHRGLYPIAAKASEEYEKARIKIAELINAEPEEIIFTSGTTDSLNIIADSLSISGLIPANPKILLSQYEHHSNILPWQKISKNIDYISPELVQDKAEFNREKYDVVSLFHVSNVTGDIIDVKKYREAFKDSFLILDSSQAAAHIKINVKKLNIDCLVFSGHKMYGPTGIGIIYVKKDILSKLEPSKRGGGMIREVHETEASWSEGPAKFEAGTPNVAGAIGLGAAAEFINGLGFGNIIEHEKHLKSLLLEKLKTIGNIRVFHSKNENSIGVVSIFIEDTHPHDIAEFLGQHNICVRAGHHCTQILHRRVFQVPATLRISLGIYNSEHDIGKLIEKLSEAAKVYRK